MSRVDFYVLNADTPQADFAFACRLTEKVYRLGQSVHLHVDDVDQASQLDALLWTFRDGSFVPHEILGMSKDTAPVTIGAAVNMPPSADVLINLSADLPPYTDRFARIAEIVTANPAKRRVSRERFRHYKSEGFTVESHTLD